MKADNVEISGQVARQEMATIISSTILTDGKLVLRLRRQRTGHAVQLATMTGHPDGQM